MIVAFALAVLAPATLSPVTVELHFDQRTKTVEVWRDNELAAEYESRDGDIYRDLLDVVREGQQTEDSPNPAMLVRSRAGRVVMN